MQEDRRKSLRILATAPLFLACGAGAASHDKAANQRRKFDFSKPEDNVEAYLKTVGSLADQSRTYLQYEADVFYLDNLKVPEIIYKVKGIARKDQTKKAVHTYEESGFDHGLICHPETGQVVDQLPNQLPRRIIVLINFMTQTL